MGWWISVWLCDGWLWKLLEVCEVCLEVCFITGRPWLFPTVLFLDPAFETFFFTFLLWSIFGVESRIFGGCLGVSRAGWTTFDFCPDFSDFFFHG